jgi:hypothetical protein
MNIKNGLLCYGGIHETNEDDGIGETDDVLEGVTIDDRNSY